MEAYPYEEEMQGVVVDDEIQCRWMMMLGNNQAGKYEDKSLLHSNRWYFYMRQKLSLIDVGYSVEVSGSDRKKVVWEVIQDHVVKYPKGNDEIVLRRLSKVQ